MEVPEVDDLDDELVFDPCPWLCYVVKIRLLTENRMMIGITLVYRVPWSDLWRDL